jgi:3-oxoadipate enol-lactonase
VKAFLGGIKLRYEVEGQGPWVTLSHALASTLSSWDSLAEALRNEFTVLRYDTRGHGQSDAPSGDYSLEQLAADAKALLDSLNVQRTHWVGLSMGGMIAQILALKHPGLLASAVLADTTSRRQGEELRRRRVALARQSGMAGLVDETLDRSFTPEFRKARTDVIKRVAAEILSTPVDGYVGCCRAISTIDLSGRLREIRCPALVLVGERDTGTPVAMAREIHEHWPGSELQVIPSAGHLSAIERPDEFNATVLDFLRRAQKKLAA